MLLVVIGAGVIACCHPVVLFNIARLKLDLSNIIAGYSWSFLAGICNAISCCANRRIQNTPVSTCTLYCGISGSITALVLACLPFTGKVLKAIDWTVGGLMVLDAFASVCVLLAWGRGLQLHNVAEVCMAVQVEIPTAMLLQYIVLHAAPNSTSLIGGFAVVIGVLLLVFKTHIIAIIVNCYDRIKCKLETEFPMTPSTSEQDKAGQWLGVVTIIYSKKEI